MIDYAAPFSWLDKHPHVYCTCCTMPQLAVYRWHTLSDGRNVPGESWHVADGTYASFTHAHVDGSSSDCDGTYLREHIELPYQGDDGQREDEWTFWHRMVSLATYAYADQGTLTVGRDLEGDRFVEWSERTDEGGRYVRYDLCGRGGCDLHTSLYRDLRAESMGY